MGLLDNPDQSDHGPPRECEFCGHEGGLEMKIVNRAQPEKWLCRVCREIDVQLICGRRGAEADSLTRSMARIAWLILERL